MLLAPLLLMFYDLVINKDADKKQPYDNPSELEPTKNVTIAGYGRFGQMIGRLLTAQGYHLSILDHSPSQIDLLRRFGNSVFYGDAARKDLLDAAGAKEATLLVLALDDADKVLDIVRIANKYYPNLKIAARARDRRHAYQLMNLNVHAFRRETFNSAVALGVDVLTLLGNSKEAAEQAGKVFAEHDQQSLVDLADLWGDDRSYGIAVKQRIEDLKQVLGNDQNKKKSLNTCSDEKQP
ncbi:NAD-binding protein [Reinekea forsetii]|nr:NAD-binding protein [Reinekea forsetii]